jgi:hypothetical protein
MDVGWMDNMRMRMFGGNEVKSNREKTIREMSSSLKLLIHGTSKLKLWGFHEGKILK